MAGSPFATGSNNPFPTPPPNPFGSPYNFGGGGTLPPNTSAPGWDPNPPPGNPNGNPPGTVGGHNWDFYSDPSTVPPGNPNAGPGQAFFTSNEPGVSVAAQTMAQKMQQYLEQMLAGAGSGGGYTMPSTSDLTKQANDQASLKYEPLIRQIQAAADAAKQNEGVASGKIGDLYGSLGRALAAQMPNITSQYNQAEDQSKQNYATLQSQIQQNYQNAQASQADQLKKLGIEAALPQSTQGLNKDQAYLTGQAANNGQALNDAMRLMGQGQSDFAQRASMIAPMQGANTQSDLAQKLLQLQNQYGQQITGYKGDEGSMAASILSQLQQAAQANQLKAQSNQSNAQMNALDQAMKYAQFQQLINPTVFGRTTGTSLGKSIANPKGYSGVADYLSSTVKDPSESSQLMSLFNDMLASNTTDPNTLRPVYQNNADQLKAILDDAKNQNVALTPQDQAYLNEMLQIYSKKY